MLRALRKLQAAVDSTTTVAAFISGGLFLATAFYITVDIIGRRFFDVFSGVTDELAGYALATGAMAGLAYTLKIGGHVRVDILLPYMRRRVRTIFDKLALLLMALFALAFSIYCWRTVQESFAMGARAVTFLGTPLVIPQSFIAFGFSLLTIEAVLLLVRPGGGPGPRPAASDTRAP